MNKKSEDICSRCGFNKYRHIILGNRENATWFDGVPCGGIENFIEKGDEEMKIFRNWKELNEPRFTTIGIIGWTGWTLMVLENGWWGFIGMLLLDFAVINYFWRECYKK